MRLFWFLLILILLIVFPAMAEYAVHDRPSFAVNTHGNAEYQTWTLTGTMPLNFMMGYAGADWVHFQSNQDTPNANNDYIKARLEGGYHMGKLGARGYGRFETKTYVGQKGLIHGGVYLNIDIIDQPTIKFHTGIGAWMHQQHFLEEYNIDTTVDMGPHLHAELQLANISVLAECLPNYTLDDYTVRIIPLWEVPLFKVLFVEQISLQLSGHIEYKSSTHHVEIEPWQWHWKHALKFGF